MKGWNHVFAAAGMVMLLGRAVQGAEFKLIANSSVDAASVSLEDVKSVYLETKMALGSGHVTPVLAKSGAAHEAFLKECLGKSEAALSTYYRSLVFTGKGAMPKALGSDAEVVEFVAKTKGAIGYVGAAAGAGSAKVLEIK
jgi:hypothetical protein